MDLDVRDAEQVEEMAEIACAFLEDLGGERILVVHGDEEHAAPVTQVFSGLTYDGIESLLFEWGAVVERSPAAFRAERYGRHVLLAPLRDSSGDCLGMLYADSREAFPDDSVEGLNNFAQHYLNLLLEICVLRAGTMVALPIDETPVDPVETKKTTTARSHPGNPETERAMSDWKFEDEDESSEYSPQEVLPDLQEYVILDWYR